MVLLFDLGGTNMRLGIAENGVLGEVVRQPNDPTAAGFARFLGALQELSKGQKIKAIAGGFPGQLRGEDGELVYAPNLPGWVGMPVRARIEELFDCPVYISNDTELCGLGEASAGAGVSSGVMAYYTVSTGVNAVRIVDGVVDATIGRFELGSQVVEVGAGEVRSLEALIGGASLEQRLGKPPREIRDREVWAGLERYLAMAVYNTILYWNPAVMVFGGRMMRDIKLDNVARELAKMPQVIGEWPEFRLAKLDDEAGLRGAMAWAAQQGYK